MTGMDILEFRDINQPPPVGKIIGDEENAPGGEDSSPPLALIGLNYAKQVAWNMNIWVQKNAYRNHEY